MNALASPLCQCGHPRVDHSWIEAFDEYDYCYAHDDCPCLLFVESPASEPLPHKGSE